MTKIFTLTYGKRLLFIISCFVAIIGLIMVQLFVLMVVNRDRLQNEGNNRSVRNLPIESYRGSIVDRFGNPLAVSTQMAALWYDGKFIDPDDERWEQVADILDLDFIELRNKLEQDKNKQARYVYLKRAVRPHQARQIMDLKLTKLPARISADEASKLSAKNIKAILGQKIAGLSVKAEYKRFYPTKELIAPVVGITDIDDIGKSGIEYTYNNWLKGKDGKLKVERDLKNRLIDLEQVVEPEEQGKDLTLSIDMRLQHMAMRELQNKVDEYQAKSGIVLIADVKTAEILAMANYPTYNPNNRNQIDANNMRNRAVTDMFEIGSTAKPLSMLAVLKSGKWPADKIVDVYPFKLELDGYTIEDTTRHNGNKLDLATILVNSSNVGMSKVALVVGAEPIYQVMRKFGLGTFGLGFVGETLGSVPYHSRKWAQSEIATLSFGYGVATNAVQLLQAYVTIAAEGNYLPLTLIKRESNQAAEQIFDADIVRQLKKMLQNVVEHPRGTVLARIPGYTVAGKSGTSRVHVGSGYSNARHNSLYVGFAPVKESRYAVLVVINEAVPKSGDKVAFGGKYAAPLFNKVMGETLRLMNVPVSKK